MSIMKTLNRYEIVDGEAREQLSSLSEKMVDKSLITLGVHTDGLVYIFVNGEPVGNGIEFSSTGDVFGYVDEDNNIVVQGNLADGEYTVKYELADGSTVDIGNLVLDSNVYYSVTKNLTACTVDNSATQVAKDSAYSATVTANDGYELSSVVVTMGGSTVSVSGGSISIASVTGDIVITAVATEKAVEPDTPSYTNFADPTSAEWMIGYRITAGNGIDGTKALDGSIITNKITVQTNDIVYVEGINFADTNNRQGAYNTAGTGGITQAQYVASQWAASGYVSDVTYDSNTFQFTNLYTVETQWRFSGLVTGTSEDVVIKIMRNGEWL